MVLTIDRKQINLDETEVSNLVTDLSEFSSLIDRTLRQCNDEPDQEQVQELLKRLNLLADIYS